MVRKTWGIVVSLASTLALSGCGRPAATEIQSISIVRADLAGELLEVEWRLVRPEDGSGSFDRPTTRESGTVTLYVDEEDVHRVEPTKVVCRTAPHPVTAESFERDRGWNAVTRFTFQAPCPAPPADPLRTRALRLVFESPPDKVSVRKDPPAKWRTPTNLLAAAEEFDRFRKQQREQRAAVGSAEIDAAKSRTRAYVAALEPLLAVVPEVAPATPDACGALPAEAAPLLDYDDLDPYAPSRIDRTLSQPRLLAALRVARDAGSTGDAELVSALGEPPRYIWIRRTFARNMGSIVWEGEGKAPKEFKPGNYRGGLFLVDRAAPKVLCGAAVVATNGAEVSAYTLRKSASGVLSDRLRADLDHHTETAVRAARNTLAGSSLPFAP